MVQIQFAYSYKRTRFLGAMFFEKMARKVKNREKWRKNAWKITDFEAFLMNLDPNLVKIMKILQVLGPKTPILANFRPKKANFWLKSGKNSLFCCFSLFAIFGQKVVFGQYFWNRKVKSNLHLKFIEIIGKEGHLPFFIVEA